MAANRVPLLAANWKMNNLWDDCEGFIAKLREIKPDYFLEDVELPLDLLICPPFPYILLAGSLLDGSAVLLGAQDVSRFDRGAYTGDVSAEMLSDLGCDYCIVGHSERRNVFGDKDEAVKAKLSRLREADVTPVLCVGEPLAGREAGRAVEHTLAQLDAVISELKQLKPGDPVLAYEPVWAIGTGRNAEPADAQEMAAAMRGWLKKNLSAEHAEETLILYGGSVKPENISSYVELEDIDGALVGGASLKAESFAALADACVG